MIDIHLICTLEVFCIIHAYLVDDCSWRHIQSARDPQQAFRQRWFKSKIRNISFGTMMERAIISTIRFLLHLAVIYVKQKPDHCESFQARHWEMPSDDATSR